MNMYHVILQYPDYLGDHDFHYFVIPAETAAKAAFFAQDEAFNRELDEEEQEVRTHDDFLVVAVLAGENITLEIFNGEPT